MTRHKSRHGEGSIYRLADPTRQKPWVAQVSLPNSTKKKTYHSTQREALAAKRRMLNELEAGQLITAKDQLVSTYLYQWLDAKWDIGEIKAGTADYYRKYIRMYLVPHIGNIKLGKLTDTHIQNCYSKLLKDGLNPNTVRLIHGILNTALGKAVKSRKIAVNPALYVDLPKKVTKEAAFLTVEQAKSLLAIASGHHFECLLVLSAMTGMRMGEVLVLHWYDIDFERCLVHVSHSLSYRDPDGDGEYQFREEDPKTERSKRVIYLPEFVLEMLHKHRIKQHEHRLACGPAWQEHDLIFPNRTGGYKHASNIRSQFRRLLAKAGLPDMPFHSLRHSLSSLLVVLVGPKAAQVILGHSTSRVTMDIYSHASEREMQEAARLLNEQFRKIGEG